MSEIRVKASCVVAEYNVSKGKPELVLVDGKQVVVGRMELSKLKGIEIGQKQQEGFNAMDVETREPVTLVNNIEKDIEAPREEEQVKKEKEPEDGMLEW